MFKEFIACVLVIASVIECSNLKRGYKVYRGEVISSWTDNPFKFIVMLAGQRTCTGSMYDTKTVISAGHCFTNPQKLPTFIALQHTNNPATDSIRIEKAYVPTLDRAPMTEAVNGEDIAVVLLVENINKYEVAHIALKYLGGKVDIGTTIILVGYGRDSSQNEGSGTLRQGRAVVAQCFAGSSDQRICVNQSTDFSNQMTEPGDSGMPLLTENNGEYFGHGVYSGKKFYENGPTQMVFAWYKRHEEYIKINVPRK